jgi:hypothetical protein
VEPYELLAARFELASEIILAAVSSYNEISLILLIRSGPIYINQDKADSIVLKMISLLILSILFK